MSHFSCGLGLQFSLQRSRKCSIVQEDEEEEDISADREELGSPLNRRGSRSEGRLNLALQERLSESERRKPACDKVSSEPPPKLEKPAKISWQATKSASVCNPSDEPDTIPTTIITDSSTITIPIITTSELADCSVLPKYKTMPSPGPAPLNEIFEEGVDDATRLQTGPRFVKRTPYEQRRSKFHKSRTASCSSSDASDDDSEKRKKRAHKLNPTPTKPIQGRRDSYDDSSDSQVCPLNSLY